MRPVVIITHLEDHDSGLVRETLEQAGCSVIESNALDGPRLPAPADVSGIVSLGGRQSAIQADRDPFLGAEVELMRAALAEEVPVFGMCLGAQLLAVAAGGRVTKMDELYLGWPELSLLPPAAGDPLFGGLATGLGVLKWHEDMIEAPRDADVLGSTPGPGAALFRVGPSAWGSQMHLEVTPPMLLDGWLSEPRGMSEVEAAGYDLDAFRADSARLVELQMAAARPIVTRFAELTQD
jgi:GMP synthase-like glutamine amidotransferase